MDARLKTPEDPRPFTREECIVETVLGIIATARKQTIWARRQPGQTWEFLSRKNQRRRNRHKN